MEWWQNALLIIPISIVGGILIGISIAYLIMHFGYKKRVSFLKLPHLLFGKKPKILTLRESAGISTDKPSAHPEVHELTELPVPGLLSEFEHNCKIAAEFSGDNVLPLQTHVWEAHKQLAIKLPITLRNQLRLIYSDINLLNRIAELSIGLGYRSSSLNGEYSRLLTKIAEQLQKIKPQIKNRTC